MKNLILSNIELYYSSSFDIKSKIIKIEGEESNHILNVMRHQIDDEIYVTNGKGKIFKCRISHVSKKIVEAKILDEFNFEERFPNITFCIPLLRNNDRLEFAVEKCTELGITNFIIYHAKRSVPKKLNLVRVEKILKAAMKQALLSWLPKIRYASSLDELSPLDGEKIVFEQSSEDYFSRDKIQREMQYIFIFGPEGDFTVDELGILNSSIKYKLAENRLRTETAIIKAASLL
jgi:16S rRNA (uracil1498-N3)-methyltransferase